MSNRIYAQYRNSPKLIKWLDIIPTINDEQLTVAEQVRTSYDIDNATTHELNVIGRIVVQPRNFESFVNVSYLSLGNVNANLGGSLAQLKPSSSVVSQNVSNDIYRILIKSKIAKNGSNATIEEVLQSIVFITGVEPAGITEGDMTFGVNFNGVLPAIAKFLLDNFDVLPKPQGVRFLGYTQEPFITRLGRNQLKTPSTTMRNTQLTGAF